MSWKNYTNQFGAADAATQKAQGDLITVTEHTENASGVLTEFELRGGAYGVDVAGVISGLTPTEDEDNDEIDIASGVAYCNGLKTVGGVSITATGSAGDYYAYIDPTESDVADAYKIKTTIPTDSELALAKFTWNGTDTITNFTDIRQFGVDYNFLHYQTQFEDTTIASYNGKIIGIYVAPKPLCIRRPSLMVYNTGTGTGGTVVLDVLTGPAIGSVSSIYSAATLKPTVNYDDVDGTINYGDIPDTAYRLVAAGSYVVVSVAVGALTDAAGMYVTVPFTYY